MNYEETLNYLYTRVPVFQHSGSSAYKPGLDTSIALDNYLHNPHTAYQTIHVGGTNGKGSTSHLLAAILQQSGYKVGLYTSPHLVDFRERIRVNGEMISKDYVVHFVEDHKKYFETLYPSFFELTMSMAFDYFRSQEVDIAIIEVGLGGRLDSTNIITPMLSIITNISLDHTQYLGNTLSAIASEKAGIIKENIPVVIGHASGEVRELFKQTATQHHAPIFFAEDEQTLIGSFFDTETGWIYQSADYGVIKGELSGIVQIENTQTVLTAVRCLLNANLNITASAIKEGFSQVVKLTGLMGRWSILQHTPKVVCDTGHNIGGIEHIVSQLAKETFDLLHIVIGVVNDKDVSGILSLLPKTAQYYFTKANIARALPEEELKALASQHTLQGNTYPSVTEALAAAKSHATAKDFIFIGGSTFIVAEAYESLVCKTPQN